jgi:4-hydroxy-tetrahydrodipicolinate reductase
MSTKSQADLTVAVYGSSGRMGQEILKIAEHEKGWGTPIAVARNGWDDLATQKVDVVIDFSSPVGLMDAIQWCVKNQTPLVSGTTGLSSDDQKKMEAASARIPLLWSANMSLGVHVLAQALKNLAVLRDWDFQIEETHHHFKKDKPSGTALFLQNQLSQIFPKKEIPPPLSLRLGAVVGTHRVSAASEEELLVFEHQALSRAVFARGALTAGAWLAKRKGKAKLYQMADVLSDFEEP